ncbi:MAG TPA: HAMP domain-containing sensor histidine kinase [Balneolaceae bacterium]|nr:HAMP domain-containing sensor histidine kinase [Balneolaceae bacterium]
MSIRSKLAWTFILLLIFGITAISSYSILFIRNFLIDEGEQNLYNDTRWLAITIESLRYNDLFETNLNEAALTSGYRIAVYDTDGVLFATVPYNEQVEAPGYLSNSIQMSLTGSDSVLVENNPDSEKIVAYSSLSNDLNPAEYLQVSQLKETLYEPIKTIRWIIYTGMFISIGLVILVSIWFARYLTRPILQLEQTAGDIADGDISKTLNLDRNDEFGKLATSLNRMASRLQEDNRRLQKIYEKQGQFFADITHELRNPLHTIAGSLEMLQLKNIDEKQKQHYLQTAIRQTERINRLFRDLVTLQRYDSDEFFIQLKRCDLSQVIEQIHELLSPAAKEKNLDFETDTDPVWVEADPGKIEQVIENLVSNAIKYTVSGKIEIRTSKTRDEVTVEIIDTGIGISKEHLDRLFDRFYRTDKARSRDKGGTGLGLSVVKSILDAHGSDIHVESKPGSGTRFWFTLPRAKEK